MALLGLDEYPCEMNPKTSHDTFGNLLRSVRQDQGLTLEALSEKCDLSASYIGLLEIQDRPAPPHPTVLSLIQGLDANEEQANQLISLAAMERGLKHGEERLPEEVQQLLVDVRKNAFELPAHFFRGLSQKIREAAK